MKQRAKVCIDRILPRDMMRFQPTVRGREGRVRAISPIGKTWMNGSTLQVRFIGGSAANRAPRANRRLGEHCREPEF
jgi:hypothetical protein